MTLAKIFPDAVKDVPVEKPISIGIDLGTTYSLMATVDTQNVNFDKSNHIPVQFVRFPQYSPLPYDQTIEDEKIASIIALYKGKPYVGNNLHHLKGHPEFKYKHNIFYHWKVEMGVDHHPLYPNAVSEKLDMPFKIAGSILNYMRINYTNGGDYALDNTIITVPASFQANQRKDSLKAAAMAKINTSETMLLDEPNAAFIGYFNRLADLEKNRWAAEVRNKNVLVVDFGGGTLDLSLLNVDFRTDSGITISNKAISRYNDLGGQDIDLLIAEEYLLPMVEPLIPDFDSLQISDIKQDIIPQLTVIAEDLKVQVCNTMSLKAGSGDVTKLALASIIGQRNHNIILFKNEEIDLGNISITAEKFKELFIKFFRGKSYSFKYYDKTIATVSTSISEIVEKADETLDAVDYVLLVGGSSFNPLLGAMIKEKMINAHLLISSEPDKLVAEGAAVYSFFMNQYGVSLISPITSDNLGVRLRSNRFFPIIEKGRSLPQKVDIPDFKLQTNMLSEVVVPVCINGADFPIGEIRCALKKIYSIDTAIKIQAEITKDKVFSMQVYAGDELIGNAEFENPFAIGKLSEEQLEAYQIQSALNKARQANNRSEEKRLLRVLIEKHYDAINYLGGLENTELYIKRFDDQDVWVWNMNHILNSKLGRKRASKEALDRAIELSPEDSVLHYNYSLILEQNSDEEALAYLESLTEGIKKQRNIKCKITLLKNDREAARKIVEEYKRSPAGYSEFQRKVLLRDLFKVLDEPYAYIDPKVTRRQEDESKYLEVSDLPF
ncbi:MULTISPECIES: Hsp70 family protein [Sphingobacterium]|uniref:Hsp70 family protein n=1 Tax=Sphingobacterium TaxID=28453 RepID=UPI0013DB483F|nr:MULTISPECIES: Hsp70 family protein [unclassified Sphingobacterium]